jgi:hypothetical protein
MLADGGEAAVEILMPERTLQENDQRAARTDDAPATEKSETLAPLLDHAPVAASAPPPPFLDSRRLAILQRAHGNHYFRSLLQRDVLFRQEPEPPEISDEESAALDAELEALLDQIRGQEPPPFEAITSTTAGEYSRGELEHEIGRLWRRQRMSFTAAARRVATQGSRGGRGPRAAESQQIDPESPYALRWSVNLFAYDYQKWGDLPEIRELFRRGAPFRRSLEADFSRVIPVMNPTGDDMRSAIYDAIFEISAATPEGQLAELVVTFSGHGGNGVIFGVDEQPLRPSDLREIGHFAQDWGVHLIYVLDTCRAGFLVSFAQASALTDIEEQLDDSPAGQAVRARLETDLLRRIGTFSSAINNRTIDLGDAYKTYRRRRNDANHVALLDAYLAFSRSFDPLRTALREALENPNLPEEDRAPIMDLQLQLVAMNTEALVTLASGVREVRSDMRQAAIVLDTTYDLMNGMIERLYQASQEGGGAGQGAGEAAGQGAAP